MLTPPWRSPDKDWAQGSKVEWRLYIDETGSFDRREEVVAVVGILIREGTPHGTPGVIRATIERELPLLPWPPHAALLRSRSVHLLIAHGRWHAGDLPGMGISKELADLAVDRLRRARPEVLARAREALRNGRYPRRSDSKALDRELRLAPESQWAVDEWIANVFAMLGRVTRVIAAAPGQGPGALVFASAEGQTGDATLEIDPASDLGSKRYATLLEVVLERVVAAMAHSGGEHMVTIDIQSRSHIHPAKGRKVQLADAPEILEAVVGRVLPAPGVRIRLGRVEFFEQVRGGGPVLADFIANTARRVLEVRPSFAEIERVVTSRSGAAVRTGKPALPNVGASGLARAFVTAAKEGRDRGDGDLDGCAPWAKDQAHEWAAHLDLERASKGSGDSR